MKLAVFLPWLLALGPSEPDRYRVRVDDLANRMVTVEADLAVPDGRLQMRRSVWSAHLPDGWATYVEGLEVRTRDGTWRPPRYEGGARWTVDIADGGPVRVRYRVRLEQERDDWPYGLKESTYVTSDWVHAVGMSLFIHSPSVADFEVVFDLPPSWEVVAPWDRGMSLSGPRFTGSGAWQLVHTVIVMGPFRPIRFTVGAAPVSLAVPAELRSAGGRLRDVLRTVAAEAAAAFGVPSSGGLSIVVARGEESGGAAFFRGLTMMTRGSLRDAAVDWKRTLAHELVHMWLGSNGIRTSAPDDEWFKEGFTSYYAAVLLARAGHLDTRRFLDELALLLRMHRAEDGPPLTAAGADERRWYDHLYGGGAIVAFCLDARLRQETAGTRTLDHVMAALHEAVAEDGRFFESRQLAEFVRSATGLALDRWIEGRVRRPDELDVEACLERFGIEETGWLPGRRRLRIAHEPRVGAVESLEDLLSPRAGG